MAELHQFPGVLVVDLAALGLTVGTVGAANVGPFVVVNAKPVQAFDQFLLRAGDGALQVGIFDAQDEGPPSAAGEEEWVQRRPSRAEVHASGRGRSETSANRFRSHEDLRT